MSWSVTVVGNPKAIVQKLEEYSASLKDQSKTEYDEAKPHIQALVSQNVFGSPGMVTVQASGHAIFKDGEKQSGTLSVKIESFYAMLALDAA